MATIANFGNGTGVIYITAANGTSVVTAMANTAANAFDVIMKAKTHKGIANHADQAGLNENNYRYFFNDSGSASIDTLSGDEITDWLVCRGFEGEFPRVSPFVAHSNPSPLEMPRIGNFQFIPIRPLQNPNPALWSRIKQIDAIDKYLEGDIIVLHLIEQSTAPFTVVSGEGNILLANNEDFFVPIHSTSEAPHHIMLRFDGTNWVEVFRNPTSGIPSVQQARANGFSVNGDGQTSALIVSGGGVVVNPNTGSRLITLANPSSINTLSSDFNVTASEVKEGDFYVVYIKGNYVGGAGDIRLFGTPITGTIVPSNTSFTRPVAVMCFYTAGQWLFWSTVDITRYMLDFDLSLTPKYAKATYDFAVNTGAAATYTVGSVPAGSLVDIDNAIILTKTALTSSGSAQVGIGLGADTDAIDNFRNYTAAPYNAINATMKANNTIAAKSQFVASDTNITLTISTAALTAGKVEIYVPYTKVV